MNVCWTSSAWEEYIYWQETDKKILKRINLLIKDIMRSPYNGIGKPEPLRFTLQGYWSRRINDEHRLVYEITGTDLFQLIVIQCKYHY